MRDGFINFYLKDQTLNFDFSKEVNILLNRMQWKYGSKIEGAKKKLLLRNRELIKYTEKQLNYYCIHIKKDSIDFDKDYQDVNLNYPPEEYANKRKIVVKNYLECDFEPLYIELGMNKKFYISRHFIINPLKRCLNKANDIYKKNKDVDMIEKNFENCYKNIVEFNIPTALKFGKKSKNIVERQYEHYGKKKTL